MDVSTKISKEDIKLVNELQVGLRKRDIKMTQKELIDRAIKFSIMDNRGEFIKMIKMKEVKDSINEKALWSKFLNSRVRIKGDFIKEHDTIL